MRNFFLLSVSIVPDNNGRMSHPPAFLQAVMKTILSFLFICLVVAALFLASSFFIRSQDVSSWNVKKTQTAYTSGYVLKRGQEELIFAEIGCCIIGAEQEDGYAEGYLFSPSENSVAYAFYPDNADYEYTELVIEDVSNGSKTRIQYVGEYDGEILYPIAWSDDERYVYTARSAPTEGNHIGVYKIDVASRTYSPIAAVTENNLVITAVDEELHAYGYVANDYGWAFVDEDDPRYEEPKRPSRLYRVHLPTEQVESFALQKSRIDSALSVSASGEYISYVRKGVVWIFNTDTLVEAPIFTINSPESKMLWQGQYMLLVERDMHGAETFHLYNASNSEHVVLGK